MSIFSFKYPKLKHPLFVMLCMPAYTKIGQRFCAGSSCTVCSLACGVSASAGGGTEEQHSHRSAPREGCSSSPALLLGSALPLRLARGVRGSAGGPTGSCSPLTRGVEGRVPCGAGQGWVSVLLLPLPMVGVQQEGVSWLSRSPLGQAQTSLLVPARSKAVSF